jgi:hypothetical protein
VVGSVAAELAAGQWQHQRRQRGTTNNQQSTKRAAGSSAVAMFPLFITHDEYFVRSGGSGGGYNVLGYGVFHLSSYELLCDQK